MVGFVVVKRAALLIARPASTWTIDEHLDGLLKLAVAVDLFLLAMNRGVSR